MAIVYPIHDKQFQMKLFTCGPVALYSCVAQTDLTAIPYFRTEEYSAITLLNLKKLSEYLDLINEGQLLYLTSSGTGAMEAVAVNCSSPQDKVLLINGGSFGKRFGEILALHHIPFTEIKLKFGEALSDAHLNHFKNNNFTQLYVNLNETSTGQLYNLQLLSDFCKAEKLDLIVDAIGSFLADELSMDKYGIDAAIISSHKGLCLAPGLSFIGLSAKMINKINESHNRTSYYFNFKDYLKNIERGQTPFTPAVFIMYQLQNMLKYIEEQGGKRYWLEQIKHRAALFSEQAASLKLHIPAYPKSNMLTPILTKTDAYQIFLKLKAQNTYVNPCGGELAHKMLRIGHLGNISEQDLIILAEQISLLDR